MTSSMEYPSNIMIPLFKIEEMIGSDLSVGLNNLKQILEK